MKRMVIAITAVLVSIAAASPALAQSVDRTTPVKRTPVNVESAHVYINRMPCVLGHSPEQHLAPCKRRSIVTLTLTPDCHVTPKARVVAVNGKTVTVRVTAVKTSGPRLCSLEPQRVLAWVTGEIERVIDASTGLEVETSVSSTF